MSARSASTSFTPNTLNEGGGENLIYIRSHRSVATFGAAALAWAALFAGLAFWAFNLPAGAVAGVALAATAVGGALFAGHSAVQLLNWPPARLCLFRDRLMVIDGRREMRAVWTAMGAVTLSEPNAWPRATLTDRLTIQLRDEPPLRIKPAAFGLEPGACRDLIVRLRDEPQLRARLPEFDSIRDLAISPVVAGELTKPLL